MAFNENIPNICIGNRDFMSETLGVTIIMQLFRYFGEETINDIFGIPNSKPIEHGRI